MESKHKKQVSTSSISAGINELSPELVPVVTLLSAQHHRRYIENNFMILHDLDNEGNPADRKWKEVYGVLSGTQLAVWDAEKLSNSRDRKLPEGQKPDYLNLSDATFKALLNLPSAGKPLNNVILISTTLKNRYILQFSTKDLLIKWHAAFRLLVFEYISLQEAYTGALLSARGAKLSDIKVILAESKYNHEHWISVRFGAGRPWKRCYAVVERNPKKAKKGGDIKGKIYLYEHDKIKKAPLLATITESSSIYAVYPNSPIVIDNSTLIKIEGKVIFNKKEGPQDSTVFVMPEAHSAVPGYDTLIRFLIPSLDAFRLYGRPKKLNADKNDPYSLLFGLPVLPHVHYLQLEDAVQLAKMTSAILWPVDEWTHHLKDVLKTKMQTGYSGCGSAHGVSGAVSSPALSGSAVASPRNPNFAPTPTRETFDTSMSGSQMSLPSPMNQNDRNINQFTLPEKAGGTMSSLNNMNKPNYQQQLKSPRRVQPPYGSNPELPTMMHSNDSDFLAPGASYNLTTSRSHNDELPLPSDRNQPRTHSPFSSSSGSSFNPGPKPVDKNKALPLPSDSNSAYGGGGASMGLATAMGAMGALGPNNPNDNKSYSRTSPSNNGGMTLQEPKMYGESNNRISQISQIYTDYASIKSPDDQQSLQNLSILTNSKEIDDTEFDLSSMLSITKIEGKRRSKRDIDIFNPAYSEDLLSPAEDITNPFTTSMNGSPASAKPTLPKINIDPSREMGNSSPSSINAAPYPVSPVKNPGRRRPPNNELRISTSNVMHGPRAYPDQGQSPMRSPRKYPNY